MCKKVGCIILVILGVILLCGITIGAFIFSDRYTPDIDDEDPYSMDLEMAVIEGSLGYPSEYIPRLAVCAEQIANNDIYCTYEMLEGSEYTYNLGYKLELPVGEYYVYAMEIDELNDPVDNYRAYYSKYVECGMDITCSSHEPILIVLSEDTSTAQNIDPIDWYNPY